MSTDTPTSDSMADNPRMPRPGQLVAERYEVIRLLGQGGFGCVYLANDQRAGGEVAVKVLDPWKSARDRFAARFRQEVMVVRKLRHHNTIKVQDVGTTDNGCLFMAMEYVEGVSLSDLIRSSGGLPPNRVVRITSQILRSLSEAHSLGVIHRDLKPSNIMIAQLRGEPDYVKVLDFGVAKALSPELSQVVTQTSEMMCTPAYAAPELLDGKQPVVAATDLYALGLIMIEMLTGRQVYADASLWTVVAKQLSPDPVAIAEEIIALPLGRVIRRTVAKRVEDRYQSAEEMLSDLIGRTGYSADLPTITGPRSQSDSASAPSETATTAVDRPPRSSRALGLVLALCILAAGAAGTYVLTAGHGRGGEGSGQALREGSGVEGPSRGLDQLVDHCAAGDFDACDEAAPQLALADSLEAVQRATSIYEGACERGVQPACVGLADLADANGTDPQRAFGLYEDACRSGVMPACVRAGAHAASGRGTARNDVRAVELYRTGCAGGVADGCLKLGYMYFSGQGVAQSYEAAHAFFQQACHGGNMRGCAVLGSLYHLGYGFGQDFERARTYYEQACQGNDMTGCTGLAALYEEGHGVDLDPARAIALYERACQNDAGVACHRLGEIFRAGQGTDPDPERARQLFSRGCELGHGESCTALQE